MKIKIEDIGFGSKSKYIIEIPNKEIDRFIDRFGKVIVKGLEEQRKKAKK